MTPMRVNDLAKELNVKNKDLIDRLIKLGVQVKNHMSILTDTAIQKVRQQFTEPKVEQVEEKRICREVIRRRKKVSDTEPSETPIPEPHEEEETVLVCTPVVPEPAEVVPESRQGVSAISAETSAVSEETPEQHAAGIEEIAPPTPEATAEPARSEPLATVQEETEKRETTEPPVVPTPAMVERQFVEAETSHQAEDLVSSPQPARIIKPAPVITVDIPETTVVETPASADAAQEEEDDDKPKKGKKRRRKKVKKDEPARIIKLPELVSEELEEEVEPELPIAPRLAVKAEVPEAKEVVRKKRPRTAEEIEKEAAERRRKTGPRKEVVGRESLYSKKELAAQQDRGRRGHRGDLREAPKPEPIVTKQGKRKIRIDEAITVAGLAKQMGIKAGEVIKKLLMLGLPATINQALDFDTAALVATDFEFEVEKTAFEEEGILQVKEDRPEDLSLRPPVITVMGHVDHGKTSLLDAIRNTDVTRGEAGGITQHIGAYNVKLQSGQVVFLDTPGHEAFTSMRARGAKVTDIVILVVAADDGVMQQTIEAINHAKAAEVPIIVAVNKIDKPNANIERVKRELADQGLISEEWGGNVTMVEISAKKHIGIDDLLEMVLLQAELMELKANPNKPARGHVIEAKLDKGRGPVATILIQEGTLRAGDIYVCGVHSGKVRNMFDDKGNRLEVAGPSIPVEVLGLSGVPNAGDDFIVIADEKQAKMVAENRLAKMREKELTRTTKVTLESLFDQIQVGAVKELNVILKTDVHGSLEAISDALQKLSTAGVKVNLIHNATGAITETDVMLASASSAIVIGFNMRSDAKVIELAEQENVDIRFYDVIYKLLSDIQDAMVGLLEPVYQEQVMGRAEVRQTFHVPKIGMIAGCMVQDGRVERNAKVRVLRDQAVVYDGRISSLRRFKDDAKDVKAGFECGIGIENFNDLKVGDVLEAYQMQEVKATLESDAADRKAGS